MTLGTQAAAVGAPPKGPFVPEPSLIRIRDLIYQVCGIFHPDNKLVFLHDRCFRRVRTLGLDGLRCYLEALTSRLTRDEEMRLLLNEITVGETCFFRSPPQIAALRKILLPRIAASSPARTGRKIRIWSAGCSTGEEPYTLAMVALEEAGGLYRNLSWEIIATDLNDRSIAHAQRGLYDAYALRNTEPYFVQKCFSREGDIFRLSPQVRSVVSFSRFNLLDETKPLFMKGLDLVFCANVLIYFDAVSKRRVVESFYNSLVPGGHLFLSSTESLFAINSQFRLVHFPGATGYLRPPNAAESAAAPSFSFEAKSESRR
ncbi:MAG TPA: protein-glutamate O-methyltransferase CheR [Candidatus Acidoferrum sp.]|nr:protein-glutamate O-methyltransferase CheR [Candidatus Acidoferrum sp.]